MKRHFDLLVWALVCLVAAEVEFFGDVVHFCARLGMLIIVFSLACRADREKRSGGIREE